MFFSIYSKAHIPSFKFYSVAHILSSVFFKNLVTSTLYNYLSTSVFRVTRLYLLNFGYFKLIKSSTPLLKQRKSITFSLLHIFYCCSHKGAGIQERITLLSIWTKDENSRATTKLKNVTANPKTGQVV